MENEKVVFNLFDGRLTTAALCKYFSLHKTEVERYLALERGYDENTMFDFIKRFNLPIDKLNTSNVFVTAKHVTTFLDNGEALKKYGLLNLRDVLEKDTPLSNFLRTKGIKFDFANKKMFFMGNNLSLFRCNNDCDSCTTGNATCSKFSDKYREAINNLHIKFYEDKSEIEVFLSGEDDSIASYTSIARNPEILLTLDRLLAAMNKPLHLANQWANLQDKEYYILEFDVSIDALEYIKESLIDNEKLTDDKLVKYYHLLGHTGPFINATSFSKRFYTNVFLVENSISVFFGDPFKNLGQIFPETVIPYKDIRISKRVLD